MRVRALFLLAIAAVATESSGGQAPRLPGPLDDSGQAKASVLHWKGESARAAAWRRAEAALARDDVEAAEEALKSGGTANDAEASRLYCGVGVRAADVEQLLRAKIALARGDAEAARTMAANAASLADAHVVASNALDELGDPEAALAELKAIESSPPPCVLLDRVLFNEGNITAEIEGGDPVPYYERAIQIAETRDGTFAGDVRNNLGQVLLRQAKFAQAEEQFRTALAAPNYRTKQYSYLGLAKAEEALGARSSATADLRTALLYDAWNRDALDFAASLTRSENAAESAAGALQLVSTALQSLPRDYVMKRYAATFETAEARLRGVRDESSDAFRIKLAEWKGDFDTARNLVQEASLRYGSRGWVHAVDAELAERSGAPDAAQKFAEASKLVKENMLSLTAAPNPWELAIIEQSTAAFRTASIANGRREDADRAKTLLASLDPRQPVDENITVTANPLNNLPLNRDYEAFMVLTPNYPSVFGSSGLENTYNIDGVTTSDMFFGPRATTLNVEPKSAEPITAPTPLSAFGGHLGETIPVAQQGVHAELEGQLQPASARAATKPTVVPTARRDDLDGRSLHADGGGPIIKDRLWVFGDATLGATRGEPVKSSIVTSHIHRVQWLSKVSYTPTENVNTSASVEHLRDSTTGVADDLAGAALGTPSAIGRDENYARKLASLSGTVIWSNDVLTDARTDLDDTTSSLAPNSAMGEAQQQRDIGEMLFASGGIGLIRDSRETRRTTFASNTSIFSGKQSIRAGAAVERDRDKLRDRLSGGSMIDETSGAFLPIDVRHSWTPVGPELNRGTTSALYVDDSIAVGNVTLAAGLRWTHQSADLAAQRHLDTSVLEPRLRMTIDPFGDNRWIINAAIGRFSSPLTPSDLIAFGSPRRYATTIQTANGLHSIGYGPLFAVDPNLRARYDDLWSAGVEHELWSKTVVGFNAQQVRLRSHIDDVFCTADQQRCLTNIPSARRQLTSFTSSINSSETFGHGKSASDLSWGAAYTWSRRTGNVEGPDITMTRVAGPDPYSRTAFDLPSTTPPDGPLANDRRHNVSAYANASRRRFHASAKVTWMSGAPRSQFGFSDLYGRYVYDLQPRGTLGDTPSVTDAFAELSYDVTHGDATMRIGIDVDHLLNRQTPLVEDDRYNFSQTIPFPNPSYGQPITRVDPRTVRLFVRFRM